MIEFARTEFKIYRVIGKYERNRDDDLCVRLGNFYTGQFECEGYESNLKLGELIDLIEERRLCKWLSSKKNIKL